MTYAVKKGNFIENMIVAHSNQKKELEDILGAELIEPSEYGLTIGDYWNGVNWTRNVSGEQVILTAVPPVAPIDERVTALEEALVITDETAIELYEAMMAQDEINMAQDDALIELYELIGG